MSDEDTLHPEAEKPQRPGDGTTQSLAPGSESAPQRPGDGTTQSLHAPGAPVSTSAGTPSTLVRSLDGAPLPSAPRPTIPGYEVLEELGRGGMGVVYKARHIGLNRIVALKMILAAEHAGREAVARFRAEAEAVAQLKHPNIVQVYDIGEQDGRPYFSMEFVEGGSLAKHIAGQPQPPKWCAEVCAKLALAMHLAHSQGIVHRDLKPANVLLAKEDEPKIMDFGLAKRLESGTTLTQSGAIMGTPQYMAPEQASGEAKRVGPPADVYALGAILYTMLTGKPPFDAETSLGVIHKVLNEEPQLPSRMQKKIPPDLETICLKCLQKEPQKRYASAHELAADLRRFLNHETIVARASSPWEKAAKWAKRRPAAAALIGVSALALVALFSGGLWYNAQLVAALQTARENEERATRNEATAKDNERAALAAQHAETQERKRAEEALLAAERNNYFNVIALAQKKIEESEWQQARELLAGVAGNRARGWEWGRLLLLCDRCFFTLKGHTKYVFSVAFSPDGKRLATASYDRTAKVWDAETGRELLTLKVTTGCIAFSPDGKHLATGSHDRTAKVWDAETGRELFTLNGHWVTSVAFSPDGTRVATGSDDKTAKVWDAETGRELLTLKGHTKSVESVAFSGDGTRVATGSKDDTAKVWDTQTGRELLTLNRDTGLGSSVAFSPVGKLMATAGDSDTATVWDAETGREIITLKEGGPSPYRIISVAFSPDGKRLVTGSEDSTVKVWDTETGHKMLDLTGHAMAVRAVCFSPDGNRLVTGSEDSTVKVWDTEVDRGVLTLNRHEAGPLAHWPLAFSPDCRRVATGSNDRTVKVWDAVTGHAILTLEGHTRDVYYVFFSPGGKRLVTIGMDLACKVWNAETGREIITFGRDWSDIRGVVLSPDGRRLAIGTGRQDKTAEIWDTETGRELLTLKGHTCVLAPWGFSPDGKRLATRSLDETAKVWDAQTGRELFTLTGHIGEVNSVLFSPDGRRLVTGSQDGTVKVWDAETGSALFTLKGYSSVSSVAFSPDGTRVATGSDDKTAKVWDMETGSELLILRGHTGFITSVAFSPDGKRLATASYDKTAKLWDAETGRELLTLRGHAGHSSVRFSSDGKRVATRSDNTAQIWEALDWTKPIEEAQRAYAAEKLGRWRAAKPPPKANR